MNCNFCILYRLNIYTVITSVVFAGWNATGNPSRESGATKILSNELEMTVAVWSSANTLSGITLNNTAIILMKHNYIFISMKTAPIHFWMWQLQITAASARQKKLHGQQTQLCMWLTSTNPEIIAEANLNCDWMKVSWTRGAECNKLQQSQQSLFLLAVMKPTS